MATASTDSSIELPPAVLSGPVPADLVPPLDGAYYDRPAGHDDDCHLEFGETDPPACVYGSPEGATTVLLLGDSHAQQWLPALQVLAQERDWRLRAIDSAVESIDLQTFIWDLDGSGDQIMENIAFLSDEGNDHAAAAEQHDPLGHFRKRRQPSHALAAVVRS